jgi:hypothetical protein
MIAVRRSKKIDDINEISLLSFIFKNDARLLAILSLRGSLLKITAASKWSFISFLH